MPWPRLMSDVTTLTSLVTAQGFVNNNRAIVVNLYAIESMGSSVLVDTIIAVVHKCDDIHVGQLS